MPPISAETHNFSDFAKLIVVHYKRICRNNKFFQRLCGAYYPKVFWPQRSKIIIIFFVKFAKAIKVNIWKIIYS